MRFVGLLETSWPTELGPPHTHQENPLFNILPTPRKLVRIWSLRNAETGWRNDNKERASRSTSADGAFRCQFDTSTKTAEVLSFASRLGRQRSETDYVMCPPIPIWVLPIIDVALCYIAVPYIQQWDSLRFTCHAMFTKSDRRTKKENDAGR